MLRIVEIFVHPSGIIVLVCEMNSEVTGWTVGSTVAATTCS